MNLSETLVKLKQDPTLPSSVRREAIDAVSNAINVKGGKTPLRTFIAMLGSSTLGAVLGKYLGLSDTGVKLLAALGAGLGTAASPGSFFEPQYLDHKGDPWKL